MVHKERVQKTFFVNINFKKPNRLILIKRERAFVYLTLVNVILQFVENALAEYSKYSNVCGDLIVSVIKTLICP